MKILAAVTAAANPEAKAKFDSEGQLDLDGSDYAFNTFDEIGVEEALRLKEAGKADEVVVVSVGSAAQDKTIRTALAMGADRAIRVDHEGTYQDSLTVAQCLAAVVESEEPDLILMGKLSVDSENNAVGQMLAQLCDLPQGTFAHKVEIEGDKVVVGREVDGGTADVRLTLPAVVTADLRLNEPRYASLPGIMKAKRKPLDVVQPPDGLEKQVRTLGYEAPPERAAGVMVETVDELVDKLKNEAKVI